MNILLTGSSGFIGRNILWDLEKRGHKVWACCRNPDKLFFRSKDTKVLKLDFIEMNAIKDWSSYLKEIDVVINCVGIIAESRLQTFKMLHTQVPVALFKAAEQVGVKKIIQISALGADKSADSAYHLSKKTADDELKKLSLDWLILQPSIVYGDGAQSMPLFHALATLPVLSVVDKGSQLIQPVHVSDVVATVIQSLETDNRHTLALVGSEAISFKQLLLQLRNRLNKKPAPIFSLPSALAQRVVFLGKWFGEPALNAENIAMLRQGNYADAAPLKKFLGRSPLSIQDKLLSKPANQAERWHAALYFLKPLLCFSIAFLWLWSGIVSIFFFPHQQSFAFLSASGISGAMAPVFLYGLALMDIALGVATLARYRIRQLIIFQLVVIILYTLTISLTLPEFWFHPFGPVLKNIPLIISLLVYLQLEGEQP